MTQTIHVRFDGKALIPEEPVDLPVGERLTVQVVPNAESARPSVHANPVDERLRRLRAIAGTVRTEHPIPLEALRRENLYGDDE